MKNKFFTTPDELHVSLDVPRYAAKTIYRWAKDQDFPEGTELEDPSEYHCTLLYSESGSHWRHHPWWIEELENGQAKVVGFDNFGPNKDGKYAYVLKIESPEIQEHGQKLTDKASELGLGVTFPEYKPHITIGYGPAKVENIEPPNMNIDLGPSSISDPRTPDPEPEPDLKESSLSSIADNLHRFYSQWGEIAPDEIVRYTHTLLKKGGYTPDDITTQAAVQAWQQIYPEDDIDYDNVGHTSGKFFRLPEYSPTYPPPGGTHSCPSCGIGLVNNGVAGYSPVKPMQSGGTQMSWYCPNCNTPFGPVATRPVERTASDEPEQVIVIPKEDEEEPYWKSLNVLPSLETDWKAMGEDEKHHNDVSFSNDTRMLP